MSDVKQEHERFHIFVNGQEYEDRDKVHHEMTGAQIAAIAGVPADNAVVRLETDGESREIPVTETLHIRDGMRFLVTHREKDHLQIFVNRRKFEEGDGVRPTMTGAQIAALVDVPADNAVVRLETGGEFREIPVTETVHIKNNMHFLVTRKLVEGGYEHGAY